MLGDGCWVTVIAQAMFFAQQKAYNNRKWQLEKNMAHQATTHLAEDSMH